MGRKKEGKKEGRTEGRKGGSFFSRGRLIVGARREHVLIPTWSQYMIKLDSHSHQEDPEDSCPSSVFYLLNNKYICIMGMLLTSHAPVFSSHMVRINEIIWVNLLALLLANSKCSINVGYYYASGWRNWLRVVKLTWPITKLRHVLAWISPLLLKQTLWIEPVPKSC